MEAQAQQQASAQEDAQQVEAFTLDRLQVRRRGPHLLSSAQAITSQLTCFVRSLA